VRALLLWLQSLLNESEISKLNCDVSLLAQGPFNLEFFKTIKFTKFQFNNIILSTWNDKKLSDALLDKMHLLQSQAGILVVQQDLPNTDFISNHANIYYQILTTLAGLRNVKTKYTLKCRADESYSNIQLVIKQFKSNVYNDSPNAVGDRYYCSSKLLCANIYFRPIEYKAFHISDHFFMGETSRLLDTFSKLKNYFEDNSDEFHILNNQCSAEQIIALFYLSTYGYDIKNLLRHQKDKAFCFEITKKYFDVFDIKVLRPYVIKHNHLKKTITNLRKVEKGTLVKYISKIEDIL
jgi:hypothetical protein